MSGLVVGVGIGFGRRRGLGGRVVLRVGFVLVLLVFVPRLVPRLGRVLVAVLVARLDPGLEPVLGPRLVRRRGIGRGMFRWARERAGLVLCLRGRVVFVLVV